MSELVDQFQQTHQLKGTRLVIYFKKPLVPNRWFWGDRFLIPLLKSLIGKNKISSLEKVYLNLCKGLNLLKVPYCSNLPFKQVRPTDQIIVLGIGPHALDGYNLPNKIVAGIGLMTHPSQWPNLFKDYPVAVYLQHSTWTAAIYNKWYGKNTCKIWPCGIDTQFWINKSTAVKQEILIYVKFLWDKEKNINEILKPILDLLNKKKISYKLITYGDYKISGYKKKLEASLGMIFLCEHESQGLAYQEAMAMNVPILAWNQGFWLDKNRFSWGEDEKIVASSVPYFDACCGEMFRNIDEFDEQFEVFYERAKSNLYQPRSYILEHLTLEKSATRMLTILKEVYQ